MPTPTRRYYSSTAVAATLSASLTSVATTIAISSVTGWPSTYPFTAIIGEDTNKEEIVTVSAVGGTTLTITRGVGGTTGQAHDAGETIRHGIYAQDFEDGSAHYAASTAVHGVAGSVVGTSDTQTLTNKTIVGTSNTLSAIPSASVTGVDTHIAATAVHGATGAVVGTTNTQTLTNKTLTSPALSSGGDVVGTTLTQTLTNKTLTTPTINVPVVTGGTYDTPTINVPVVTGGTYDTPTLTTPAISSTGFFYAQHDHSATNAGGAIGFPYGLVFDGAGIACANNTWTLITFNTQTVVSSAAVHSTSTNPSRLIVPTSQTGFYSVKASVTFPDNATGFRRIQIRKNSAGSATGGTLIGTTHLPALTTASQTTTVVYGRDASLTAADYVEVFALQTSGGSLTTTTAEAYTSFSIRRAV